MSNQEEDAPSLSPVIVPDGEGTIHHAFGDTVQVKLRGEDTGGLLSVGIGIAPPGGGPPIHRHYNEDELFYILEGRIRFLTNDEWTEVAPGGVVFLPRGSVHTFQNVGETPGKMLVITTSSGFATFFEKCAGVFAAAGPPDMGRIMSICGEHGIEILGPPPGAQH